MGSAVAGWVVGFDKVGLDLKPLAFAGHPRDGHPVSLMAEPAQLLVVRVKTPQQVTCLADVKNSVLFEDEVNTTHSIELSVQWIDGEGVISA
jgi:hypothetical protein